jgi:hypothetical protein
MSVSTETRYKPIQQLDACEIDALKPVIGTRQFCGIGGISLNTGQKLMKSGKLKTARKVGHSWRMSKREALQFFGLATD